MDFLVSAVAQYLIFVVAFVAVVVTLLSKKTIRNKIIRLAILSFIFAFLLNYIAGLSYYDARPFVVEHIQPLFPYRPDNGFPSEHTLAATFVSAVIFPYSRRMGIILGVSAILIGIARVMAEVHHPIDIVAGIAIAIVSTTVAWLILRIMEKSSWWASLLKSIQSNWPNRKSDSK